MLQQVATLHNEVRSLSLRRETCRREDNGGEGTKGGEEEVIDEKQSKKPVKEKKKENMKPAVARMKRRKRYYTLEHKLAPMWKKMRCYSIVKEDRSKFVTEALQMMKCEIPKITRSHISSRQMVGLVIVQHEYELAHATLK
jgi:hypothetical protein